MSAIRLLTALCLMICLCVVSGCSPSESQANPADQIVATIGGSHIMMSELEAKASGGLLNLEQKRFELLSTTLNEMMRDSMLQHEADSRGMTVLELEAAEIDAQVLNPTQDEVAKYYADNRDKTANYTLDDVRNSIVVFLREQRELALRQALYDSLRAKYTATRDLTPPRAEVAVTAQDMVRGPAGAPITVVEYGDFQCPYCRRAHVVVDRVMAEYGSQVQFIFRDYPLDNHSRAIPASKAAYCADEQELFWDFYDHLMLMTGDLSDNDLTGRAQQLGLNVDNFRECYTSTRYEDLIAVNTAQGASLGVKATPTFFINGRMLVGVKTFEEWKLILDEELQLSGRSG